MVAPGLRAAVRRGRDIDDWAYRDACGTLDAAGRTFLGGAGPPGRPRLSGGAHGRAALADIGERVAAVIEVPR